MDLSPFYMLPHWFFVKTYFPSLVLLVLSLARPSLEGVRPLLPSFFETIWSFLGLHGS